MRISDWSSDVCSSDLLALMVISFPLGSAVCGLIASELIAVFGWRAAFIPGVVLPPLVILLSLRWLPEPLGLLIEKPRPSSLKRVNSYLKSIGQSPVERLPPPTHQGQTPIGRVVGTDLLRPKTGGASGGEKVVPKG